MRKEHAEHNEYACDYLLKSGEFNDWVVTTAFYPALHYVQHKIFPLKIGETTYNSLNSYYANVIKRIDSKTDKHKTLVNLVFDKIPAVATYYRWLYNICMTARYNDYNISSQKASLAKKRLTFIREACKA